MKVLVTGSNGFVGQHLQKIIDIIPFQGPHREFIDLRQTNLVENFCDQVQPDAVIHLAAQSFVPHSFQDPLKTYEINFLGTLNLLNALKKIGFTGNFLYVGSGDVYGVVPLTSLPIKEDFPLKPRSPYAVSKAAAEALCFQWSQCENFKIVLARPFNQIGPGQAEHFAVSTFAKQLIEIKHSLKDPILEVGNLDVTRDFTDVRDVVQAFLFLLKQGKNGEVYNVCTNKEVSLRDILNRLIALSQIDACALSIHDSSSRQRKAEQSRVVGSNQKIIDESGWKPQISLDQTLQDTLNYWENSLICEKKH